MKAAAAISQSRGNRAFAHPGAANYFNYLRGHFSMNRTFLFPGDPLFLNPAVNGLHRKNFYRLSLNISVPDSRKNCKQIAEAYILTRV